MIGYEADVDETKATISEALADTIGVVVDPTPTVHVTELTSEGVSITVTFWIDTFEMRPRDVFDQAATSILQVLDRTGVELYPPGSVIVRPEHETGESNGNAPMKSVLEN
jgi:small-conductance mechanosensitive channel